MEHANETQTFILATEGITGIAQKYDKAAKLLLADPQILSRVLIGTIQELSGMDPDAVIRECLFGEPLVESEPVERSDRARSRVGQVTNEDAPLTEHAVYFDIRTVIRLPDTDESVLVEVDVESQREGTGLTYPLGKRIIY